MKQVLGTDNNLRRNKLNLEKYHCTSCKIKSKYCQLKVNNMCSFKHVSTAKFKHNKHGESEFTVITNSC